MPLHEQKLALTGFVLFRDFPPPAENLLGSSTLSQCGGTRWLPYRGEPMIHLGAIRRMRSSLTQ